MNTFQNKIHGFLILNKVPKWSVAVSVSLFIVFWIAGCNKQNSLKFSSLSISQEKVNLGNIEEGKQKGGILELQNIDKLPILIESVSASCACTLAKVERQRIAPNQKTNLIFKLSAAGRRGLFSSKITIKWRVLGRGVETSVIKVTANAVFVAATSKSLVDFGLIKSAHAVQGSDFRITRGTDEANFSKIIISSASSALKCNITQKTENDWYASVDLSLEKLPEGIFLSKIELQFFSNDGIEIARREVPVRAQIVGTTSALPSKLFFGVLHPNETKRGNMAFTFSGKKVIKIKNITSTSNKFQFLVVQSTHEPGFIKLVYDFNPGWMTGDVNGNIVVEFDDLQMKKINIPFFGFVSQSVD